MRCAGKPSGCPASSTGPSIFGRTEDLDRRVFICRERKRIKLKGPDEGLPELAGDNDYELLNFMLNGARPRYRRERYRDQKLPVEVTDPSMLEPYERLFYDEDLSRSKGDVALNAFYWSEHFSYDEAVAWFAAGASTRDLHWCIELKRARVIPEVAAKPLTKRGVDTGMTIFRAVATHVITAQRVRQMMDAREQEERPA
jgi:hypothetical protein